MSDDIGPGDVMNAFWKWFGTGLFFLLVLSGLIFIGWHAGWWFTSQNANREAHVIRQGYSNQQTLREQVAAKLGDITDLTVKIDQSQQGDAALVAPLKAQRLAVAAIACRDIAEVTGDPLPADQQAWAKANCAYGSVSPNSPLRN